jgi:hypothetical protein
LFYVVIVWRGYITAIFTKFRLQICMTELVPGILGLFTQLIVPESEAVGRLLVKQSGSREYLARFTSNSPNSVSILELGWSPDKRLELEGFAKPFSLLCEGRNGTSGALEGP